KKSSQPPRSRRSAVKSAFSFLAGLGIGGTMSKLGREVTMHGAVVTTVEAVRPRIEQTLHDFSKVHHSVAHQRAELLEQIFLNPANAVDAVPGDRHHHKAPDLSFGGIPSYATDFFALTAIKAGYDSSQLFEVEAKRWDVTDGHSLICTGAPHSNTVVEEIL